MKISKNITNPVESSFSEFNNALREACFALLKELGEEGESIKLEKPISLVSSKVNGKKNESVVSVATAKYISYVLPYEGRPESGFYLLCSEECSYNTHSNDVDALVSSDIYMTLDNRVKVYEMLKSMVRHK
jgi:hypothetical protein